MKALFVACLLVCSPAAAQMSSVGCNALSTAANGASSSLDDILSRMDSTAFRKAMPYMPESAKASAENLEDRRMAAQLALSNYQSALQQFAKDIKDCGE